MIVKVIIKYLAIKQLFLLLAKKKLDSINDIDVWMINYKCLKIVY